MTLDPNHAVSLILLFSDTEALIEVGWLPFIHLLIFFSQLSSYGVYHVSKGSINHIERRVKNNEESGIGPESLQYHPWNKPIHTNCSPSLTSKYQTSVDSMRLVKELELIKCGDILSKAGHSSLSANPWV